MTRKNKKRTPIFSALASSLGSELRGASLRVSPLDACGEKGQRSDVK